VTDAAERAERLYLFLAQLRGVPYLSPEEAIDMTPLTHRGLATVPQVTDDDLALATELLNVEAARREEQYAALELLNSLDAGTRGTFDERVLALDGREFAAACGCLLTLGWLDHD
jgi:hypothetical protein